MKASQRLRDSLSELSQRTDDLSWRLRRLSYAMEDGPERERLLADRELLEARRAELRQELYWGEHR